MFHVLHKLYMPFEFSCDGCNTRGHGTRYRCPACDFDLHELCAICPHYISSHVHPGHHLFQVNRPQTFTIIVTFVVATLMGLATLVEHVGLMHILYVLRFLQRYALHPLVVIMGPFLFTLNRFVTHKALSHRVSRQLCIVIPIAKTGIASPETEIIYSKMEVYSKHIDWGQVKITKDIIEGDKEAEIEVAKESEDMTLSIMKDDKGKGKEAEHDHLKVNKDDKGKGKVHDIQNRLGKLEVDLARTIKAKQVDDHDDDLDTLDLENRIKKCNTCKKFLNLCR
uniref:DC1 domain-containing protein n=1 Tax=Tanacetum cinerariifolium TaxID=118510 RepID=A0A699HLW5_TANCI|nr:hypothetical protein [Tanacetum cinerariifolium]